MSLLDAVGMPAAIIDSIDRYGINPMGVPIEVGNRPTIGVVAEQAVVLAGTSNYLGLTMDPECIAAAVAATQRYGTGTTGSRMANGTYPVHRELEARLADYFDARSAMVFTTGYQANLGVIAGLAGAGDAVVVDADSHASIYDGARLSGAQVFRFKHNSPEHLDRRLTKLGALATRAVVVVEGIYSMMGDRAPLADLVPVVRKHGALLLVDEAHSFGVIGPTGLGRAEEAGVLQEVDLIVGTFSKSLGAVGGYCVSPKHDLDPIRARARAYTFTASPAPATAASVIAALRVLAEQPDLRSRLASRCERLWHGLTALGIDVPETPGPILPVRLDDERAAVDAWHLLLHAGVYVNLVVPPASPGNFALLRCSLSAAHTDEDVDQIVAGFGRVFS